MKNFKRITALGLTMVLMLSLIGCKPKTVPSDDIEAAIQSSGKYLTKSTYKPTYGDEWMIVALLRSNYIDYWHNRVVVYESAMNNFLSRNSGVVGKDGEVYAQAYPSVIFAYTALGKYADRTSSANLLMGVSFDSVVLEGGYINKINALTAVKCGGYDMYADGDLTVQQLIDFVLSLQTENGSFQYKGMNDTAIKVTACAVQALSLVDQSEEIKTAIKAGTDYLASHIREDDSLDDIANTVIALNGAGISARDVEGNDLIAWILKYQKSDGSFTQDAAAKKGNKEETATALMGLASQYRYNNGLTSFYDMSDVCGGTHNKLSPEWSAYVNLMKFFGAGMIIFMIILLIVSRVRIAKWKKQGIYNHALGRMMTDAEIAQREAEKNSAAVQTVDAEVVTDVQEPNDNGPITNETDEGSAETDGPDTPKTEG